MVTFPILFPLLGNVTTLLFDLGGVLIELGSLQQMMASSPFDDQPVMKYFEMSFLSHQTGILKPDRAAFDNLLRRLGAEPGEVLFSMTIRATLPRRQT